MEHEIKIGTVSWINRDPNPIWTATQVKLLTPEWIPKTYLGLAATCNEAPPATLDDFPTYQKARDFRAMTYCHFRVAIDEKNDGVTGLQVIQAVHDGGWTPPFRHASWPATIPVPDTWKSTSYHQGEYSPISLVNTEARHRCSAIVDVPASETVLVNMLVKFRAGKHTDDVGIKDVGSPFHVPWVWCEMLLTYSAEGFKAYGRGSLFPSHAWYLDGRQIRTVGQVGDHMFPLSRIVPPWVPGPSSPIRFMPSPGIDQNGLRIYRVLASGAPARGPQAPLDDERSCTGAVDNNTAPSATSTTLPPGTQLLDLVTAIGSGNCGPIRDGSATVLGSIACGELDRGGGNSLVAELGIPDGATSRFLVASCDGSVCMLGPTDTSNDGIDCTAAGCNLGTPLPIPYPPLLVAQHLRAEHLERAGERHAGQEHWRSLAGCPALIEHLPHFEPLLAVPALFRLVPRPGGRPDVRRRPSLRCRRPPADGCHPAGPAARTVAGDGRSHPAGRPRLARPLSEHLGATNACPQSRTTVREMVGGLPWSPRAHGMCLAWRLPSGARAWRRRR